MQNVFPKAKIEWRQLVLLPLKSCIFLIPMAFIILMIEEGTPHFDRMRISDQIINLMVVGYFGCIIVLAVEGIVAAILMRNWKLMRSGLVYAGIGIFLASMFVLPGLAATK